MRRRLPAAMSAVLLLSGGCQSMAAPAPAVLARADAATMERLKASLAKAVGRAPIELGPGDPTQSPQITVLPRPPSPQEDRSLAKPTNFRLEVEAKSCSLVREDTGARTLLDGVECRPVAG